MQCSVMLCNLVLCYVSFKSLSLYLSLSIFMHECITYIHIHICVHACQVFSIYFCPRWRSLRWKTQMDSGFGSPYVGAPRWVPGFGNANPGGANGHESQLHGVDSWESSCGKSGEAYGNAVLFWQLGHFPGYHVSICFFQYLPIL